MIIFLIETLVYSMCANFLCIEAWKDGRPNTQKLKMLKSACYVVGTL